MQIAADVQTELHLGRSNRFEWLPPEPSHKTVAKTLVAMANHSGGMIVVGVDEERKVLGVDDVRACKDLLIEAALETTPPLIVPLPQSITLHDKTVVVMQVPTGMPHVYAYKGRYLTRSGNRNLPLDPEALRQLMMERGEISFETNIAIGASLDDIDWDKAKEYADSLIGYDANDVQRVLLRRGCLLLQQDEIVPTNAGLLLFGKDPQRFIVGSDITAVRFAGESMGDTFNRQDIGGTLPDQIKRAETFLRDNMRKDVTISDRMARQETYEYPMEAARELIVNAVAHRDYSVRGDNIRVCIFSNRMEVYSPGGLPGPVTIQNIKDERFSRNPVVVQVLSDMHFIEKLGYGVDRVMELMKAQNLTDPEFQERAGGFEVVLRKPAVQIKQPLVMERSKPRPVVAFHGKYRGIEINPRQEAALVFLHGAENARITNSDLKELFPDIHPETLRRDLADLVQKAILVKMGQKRGSYYVLHDA